MGLLITAVLAVLIVGLLQTIIAGKIIKTLFKGVITLALLSCVVIFIYTGSMPKQETLEETKDAIVTQLKDEVSKNGKVTEALEDKINNYNSLVDKAQSFQDNKFIGGLIAYDLTDLKIDLSEWE